MVELRDEARALLEAARFAHDPSPAEREQADRVVRAALASYGLQVPPLSPPLPPSVPPPLPPSVPPLPPAIGAPPPLPPWHGLDATPAATAPTCLGAAGAAKLGVGVLALCASVALGLDVSQREAPRSAHATQSATRAATPAANIAAPSHAAPVVAPPAVVPSLPEPEIVEAAIPTERPLVAHAQPRSRLSSRREPEPRAGIDAELQLIAEADALLREERFDAALQTLAAHARSFPRGALREERAALLVLSLCGKRPDSEALRERERFLRTAPKSVLTARVSAACADAGSRAP